MGDEPQSGNVFKQTFFYQFSGSLKHAILLSSSIYIFYRSDSTWDFETEIISVSNLSQTNWFAVGKIQGRSHDANILALYLSLYY